MEEIINNVMQSPENTNPNVLRSQLQSVGGSGGGVFFVDCTPGESKITAEKTAGEIFEAVESGLVVIFKFTAASLAVYMHCVSADNYDGYNFVVALHSGSSVSVDRFTALNSSDNPVLDAK